MVPATPTAHAVVGDAAAIPLRVRLVLLDCGFHVVPSSLRKIWPPSPTAHAVATEGVVIARRLASTPDACAVHVRPPSPVARIVPPLPTARASKAEIPATASSWALEP